ncbi:MAG TPA: ABC transporter substrate-binding protein, partial [Ktedonobacterales bacterium]|nr:ABC transporter substrate-binding protein [Ktedonobacterales bacterium]
MNKRMGMRWHGMILLAALATMLLAGCALPPLPWQARSPAPLPDAQQVLRIALPGISASQLALDPIAFPADGALTPLMVSLTYSTLLTFDAGLRPTPSLATRYSVSADGLRYTFHLRPNARFADGAPLT